MLTVFRSSSLRGLLISALIIAAGLFGNITFSEKLYFNNTGLSIHLYCQTGSTFIMISGAAYNGFNFDILHDANLRYDADWVGLSSPLQEGAITKTFCSSIPNCLRFNTSPLAYNTSGVKQGGTFYVTNSGFTRTELLVPNYVVTPPSSQVTRYGDSTNYFTESGSLALDFFLGPCAADNDAPTFGFTGAMVPHITNYTGPQFNDRIYRFDLRDMAGELDFGFYSGYTSPWDPDWTGGTYYSTGPTVLNGSGIDLATFTMQVAVETAPDSSAFSNVTYTGTINFTGGSVITGSTGGLLFYPYDFTWHRQNRNYTGSLTTGALWPSSTLDVDGNWSFGTEKEVIMTGYVRDRATNLSNIFSVRFNYGAIPWSSNKQSSGLVQYCGPNGTQTLGVSAPASDSGAYITKYNSYFVIEPFKVYLHDDWAGIDSGTIIIILSGTQNGTPTIIKLTGNVTPGVNLGLTAFQWTGPISIATAGNGTRNVFSVSGSMRNYEVLVNYTGKWDAETRIDVSIDYKDLVARTGTQVICNYVNTYAPYVNNRTGDVRLNRTPFSSGARLSGLLIRVEDEWAGVNSGTIVLTISGRTINDILNRTTAAVNLVFSGSNLFPWLSAYTTHTGTITGGQVYNYIITIPENADYSGYFAPEHPFVITLTYTDFAGRVQTATKQYVNLDTPASYAALYSGNTAASPYTNTNSLLVDINQNPLLRRFSVLTDPIDSLSDWLEAFPIRTYGNVTGGTANIQYSGLQFAIFDHRAGIDSGYNFVTVTGYRRGNLATYHFATSDSTGKIWSQWTSCDGSTCLTGDMTKVAELVPDYDQFTGQHPTIQRSTGYKFQITGHSMYFDYGTYSGNTALTSLYNVTVYGSDLRPDDPNNITRYTGLALDYLQCKFLDRCSHEFLTFVRGPNINTNVNATITQNPLTGSIETPFAGSRLSVVGSGVSIDTGTHILYCNAAGGSLDTPITISFTGVAQLGGTPATTGYSNITLKVADGLFVLTGASANILLVK